MYKVPPLTTASGHRAESFGLDNPLFTGHLKVIQTDLKLRVAIYRYKDVTTLLTTPENLILFGECPIEIEPKGDITPFVDSVADSSRYFVIRIKDPASKRSVSIGIGFRERETAFDFKSSLNEYVRYVDRMCTANEMSKEQADLMGDDEEAAGAVKQLKDMSLQEGVKIHVKGTGKRLAAPKASGGGMLGLKPPPPAGSVIHVKTAQEIAEANAGAAAAALAAVTSSGSDGFGDDDWGDMTSATATTTDTTKKSDDEDWGDFS